MTWLESPAHSRWLESETDRLLAFGAGSALPSGAFGWLGSNGALVPQAPELWVTCRQVHCFAIAGLMGRPGFARLVDGGLAALRTVFEDADHGGWFSVAPGEGELPIKAAYPHAFVVLAASSAAVAGRPGARALLDRALAVEERYFWDEDAGMVREEWDAAFEVCDEYRGVNANMHTVEAYLAAADVTGDPLWRERALRITERVVHGFARHNSWRIPEHFDAEWRPQLEFNAAAKADPFRPYGATIGHSFEWARLCIHVAAALGEAAPAWLRGDAIELFARATSEGWHVDGAPGFVYTVDWEGRPVVRERMHWVVCEAIGAAAILQRETGEDRFAERYQEWWEYAATFHMDRVGGSWWHELDPGNAPSATIWDGKPDIYHAVQATLIPRLPAAPSLATAVARGLLD